MINKKKILIKYVRVKIKNKNKLDFKINKYKNKFYNIVLKKCIIRFFFFFLFYFINLI